MLCSACNRALSLESATTDGHGNPVCKFCKDTMSVRDLCNTVYSNLKAKKEQEELLKKTQQAIADQKREIENSIFNAGPSTPVDYENDRDEKWDDALQLALSLEIISPDLIKKHLKIPIRRAYNIVACMEYNRLIEWYDGRHSERKIYKDKIIKLLGNKVKPADIKLNTVVPTTTSKDYKKTNLKENTKKILKYILIIYLISLFVYFLIKKWS